jgi:hypothetical protein
MSNIAILPAHGSRIQVGYLTGQNTAATNAVQDQLDDKGFPVKANNQGHGANITFSQDIVSMPIGNKESGFEFKAGAEISAGLMKVEKNVKTGEKDVWVVDVREEEQRYDPHTERYYTYTNYYSRAFENERDADWYSRQMNYYNGSGYTYASYPRPGIMDIIDRSSSTVGSLKLGVTAGVQKNFSGFSVRADALTGYDVIQGNAYVGGRLTVATDYYFENSKIGLYGQYDKDVTGPYKDARGQVGVSVGF